MLESGRQPPRRERELVITTLDLGGWEALEARLRQYSRSADTLRRTTQSPVSRSPEVRGKETEAGDQHPPARVAPFHALRRRSRRATVPAAAPPLPSPVLKHEAYRRMQRALGRRGR